MSWENLICPFDKQAMTNLSLSKNLLVFMYKILRFIVWVFFFSMHKWVLSVLIMWSAMAQW